MAIKGNNKAMKPTDKVVKTKDTLLKVYIIKGVRVEATNIDMAYEAYQKTLKTNK